MAYHFGTQKNTKSANFPNAVEIMADTEISEAPATTGAETQHAGNYHFGRIDGIVR